MAMLDKFLLKTQSLLTKLHPTFVKGFVSIIIAFLIFQQMWFGGDDSAKYISPVGLYWLNWILGSIAIVMNSMRDALSAYYGDKIVKEDKSETGRVEVSVKPPNTGSNA